MVYDYGLGRHRRYLRPRDFRHYRQYQYGQWIQFMWTITATQTSMCLLLLRANISKKIQPSMKIVVGILIVSNTILILIWIFQCNPVGLAWIRTKRGQCLSNDQIQGVLIAQGVISTLAHLIFALSPILILRYFRVNIRCKIALGILSSLELLVAACSIVRTAYSWETVAVDQTWLIAAHMWRGAEANLVIAVACIPTLPLLCRFVLGTSPPAPRDPGDLPSEAFSIPPQRPYRPSRTRAPGSTSTGEDAASPQPVSSKVSLPEYRIPIRKTSEDIMTTTTGETIVDDNLNSGNIQDTSWFEEPPQPEWSKAWLATDSNASTT